MEETTKKKYHYVPTRVHTRKIDRMVAHNVMKENDYKKVNKHDYNTYITPSGMKLQERIGSFFSSHWKSAANEYKEERK